MSAGAVLAAAAGHGDVGQALLFAYWAGRHEADSRHFIVPCVKEEAQRNSEDAIAKAVEYIGAWREAGRPVPPPEKAAARAAVRALLAEHPELRVQSQPPEPAPEPAPAAANDTVQP